MSENFNDKINILKVLLINSILVGTLNPPPNLHLKAYENGNTRILLIQVV